MLYHPTELVKSQDVIVRVGSIAGTTRPVITQSGATFTVTGAPTLYTLQAATTASVAFNDGNQEFYLLGGGGFADSVIVTSQATASITSYFQKDVDGTTFLPNSFDEAFQVITASRYDKTAEVYVEINKQLGSSGTTFFYDRVAYVAAVMNYNESYPADNLVECTFDLVSRGRIGIHQSATSSGSIIPIAPNS
jgi:dihydrofolate reductase